MQRLTTTYITQPLMASDAAKISKNNTELAIQIKAIEKLIRLAAENGAWDIRTACSIDGIEDTIQTLCAMGYNVKKKYITRLNTSRH